MVLAKALELGEYTGKPQALRLGVVGFVPCKAGIAVGCRGDFAVRHTRQHGVAHAQMFQVHKVTLRVDLVGGDGGDAGSRVHGPLRLALAMSCEQRAKAVRLKMKVLGSITGVGTEPVHFKAGATEGGLVLRVVAVQLQRTKIGVEQHHVGVMHHAGAVAPDASC